MEQIEELTIKREDAESRTDEVVQKAKNAEKKQS